MKKCYLIRHGLPAFPDGKKMCLGTTDLPLGAEGISQAQRMAAVLPPVTAVFSSNLSRAIQTAQPIGRTVTVLEGLREMYAGAWDGLTFDQIKEKFPELYAARQQNMTLPLPNAEDTAQALVRFSDAMQQAAELAPGDFAVVAHGGIIANFMEALTGTWYKPDYAEVILLYWKDGAYYQ